MLIFHFDLFILIDGIFISHNHQRHLMLSYQSVLHFVPFISYLIDVWKLNLVMNDSILVRMASKIVFDVVEKVKNDNVINSMIILITGIIHKNNNNQ